MRVAVVFDLRQKYAVSDLLKIAKVPRSTSYYYANKIGKGDKYESVKEKSKRYIK